MWIYEPMKSQAKSDFKTNVQSMFHHIKNKLLLNKSFSWEKQFQFLRILTSNDTKVSFESSYFNYPAYAAYLDVENVVDTLSKLDSIVISIV